LKGGVVLFWVVVLNFGVYILSIGEFGSIFLCILVVNVCFSVVKSCLDFGVLIYLLGSGGIISGGMFCWRRLKCTVRDFVVYVIVYGTLG